MTSPSANRFVLTPTRASGATDTLGLGRVVRLECRWPSPLEANVTLSRTFLHIPYDLTFRGGGEHIMLTMLNQPSMRGGMIIRISHDVGGVLAGL